MPKTYKTRSKKRYSPYGKKTAMRTVVAPVPRSLPVLMSNNFQANLRYTTTVTLSPSTGTVAKHNFVANGLFDPDHTGVGHQPRGFDQLMALYKHYTVTKCVMKVWAGASGFTTGSNYTPFQLTIAEDNRALTITDPEDFQEKSRLVTRLQNVQNTPSHPLKYTCYPQRRLGNNNPGNDSDKGDVTSNPEDKIFLRLGAFFLESAASGDIQCQVQLDFTTIFSEIHQPTKS